MKKRNLTLVWLLATYFLISCNATTQKGIQDFQTACKRLTLLKKDSISNNILKEIQSLANDSILQIKKSSSNDSKDVYFNDLYITGSIEDGYDALFFKSNNLIFIFDYQLFIFNKQNKKGYKLPSIQTPSGFPKSLFCFKNKLIYHLTELYDPYYERDLYIIVDSELNTIQAFAVPSIVETTGTPIQEFLYQSKNKLLENKDGELVISMSITITKNEKNKQNFSVEIPFNEEFGNFIDLKKILPLISPDIPISNTENIFMMIPPKTGQ